MRLTSNSFIQTKLLWTPRTSIRILDHLFVIFIYPERSCCPVQLILNFLAVRGSVSGPLFCWPDGSPNSRSYFVERLNAALAFCNLDSKLYKAYSSRIGVLPVAHLPRGFQTPKFAARWKSSAFFVMLELQV